MSENIKKEAKKLFFEAIIESWVAWSAIFFMVGMMISHGNPLLIGFSILVAAVLGMNGLARTDMWLTSEGPGWWKKHKFLKIFHHITNEGELAGIFVGLIALVTLYFTHGAEHIHFAYAEAFTLLGIMSAANIAVQHMIPVMGLIEKLFGIRGVIVIGSLLSSLTGEPAASVFLAEYVKNRVKEEDRPRVATGLAATIGSGGGLMPFAAPPILIVWAILSSQFGWGITSLIAFIGVGCIAHVITASFMFKKYIQPHNGEKTPFEKKGILPLLLLIAVVLAHIFYHGLALWVVDGVLGFSAWYLARKKYHNCPEDLREDAFTAKWQPLILATLLVALEIIGIVADPLITAIAKLIPTTLPAVVIGILLFFATTWVSHFADNALASRIFITIPVALIPVLGMSVSAMLAACVVMAALFGGFLLIPANLPNFYLARALKVGPGAWVKISWILYPTGLAYIAWILLRFYLLK